MGKCVSKQTSATTLANIRTTTNLEHNKDVRSVNDNKEESNFGNSNYTREEQDPVDHGYTNSDDRNKTIVKICREKVRESVRGAYGRVVGGEVVKERQRRLNNEGQSESKRSSKRGGPETKGTAMSFGFRKKLIIAQNKNHTNSNEEEKVQVVCDLKRKEDFTSTVISNTKTTSAKNTKESFGDTIKTADKKLSDDNGNDRTESVAFEASRATLRTILPRRDTPGIRPISVASSAGTYKGSRFGFKSSNIVRPASTEITPKVSNIEEHIENNNCIASDKRRSKSASGVNSTRPLTSNRNQHHVRFDDQKYFGPKIGSTAAAPVSIAFNNSTTGNQQQKNRSSEPPSALESVNRFGNRPSLDHQPHLYTAINTGMHTNIIVRPVPKTCQITVSKFTLHTASLPKPQYPVPISLTSPINNTMETKNAKQVANNNRKGFQGPRDISTDSGLASVGSIASNQSFENGQHELRSTSCGSSSATHLTRRPRNLEMVISGRHKFEVRDLDDSLSSDSIEPLALPKLPSVFSPNNRTVPSGLVRTNSSLNQDDVQIQRSQENGSGTRNIFRAPSDVGSLEEEKLFIDRSTPEKKNKNPTVKDYTSSSKNSSPGSSRASWCNAGESLAQKDCSSFSLSSDDSKDNQNEKTSVDLQVESISFGNSEGERNLLLSFDESALKSSDKKLSFQNERPPALPNIAETKFAEMAAAVSDALLDDETSPTDSLVSSTESDGAVAKKHKKRISEDFQEKHPDEIFPEIDSCSPLSPGTPTHASNSISLSENGGMIDDEIADQPALLFSDKADMMDALQLAHSLTDTPTLMESGSNKFSAQIASKKKGDMPVASEAAAVTTSIPNISLKNPLSPLCNPASFLGRSESLDTLSPCESIASDDLMMDFESQSSLGSAERLPQSIRSRSGSAPKCFDDALVWSELEAKSNEMMKEWNNILRVHQTSKDDIISQLPARATRILNRSRLLQQSQLTITGSDSLKSVESLPRKLRSRTSSLHSCGAKEANSSSDDLCPQDKFFRNSMIQDVLYFKNQLIRLRRLLQEDEDQLMRTDTLNPFDLGNNGQSFASSCGLDSSKLQQLSEDKDLHGLGSEAAAILEDRRQELADLRRQVVYLQGQVEDRDRTIRIQKGLICKLEAEKESGPILVSSIAEKECVNTATQTERARPIAVEQEGLSRSKIDTNSEMYLPVKEVQERAGINNTKYVTASTGSPTSQHNTGRRHTIISSATLSNLDQHLSSLQTQRRASLDWQRFRTYKPVKITLIGDPTLLIQNISNTNQSVSSFSSTENGQSLAKTSSAKLLATKNSSTIDSGNSKSDEAYNSMKANRKDINLQKLENSAGNLNGNIGSHYYYTNDKNQNFNEHKKSEHTRSQIITIV